jgi:hypothetical protein
MSPGEARNAHVPPLAWSAGYELDVHHGTKVHKRLHTSSVKPSQNFQRGSAIYIFEVLLHIRSVSAILFPMR